MKEFSTAIRESEEADVEWELDDDGNLLLNDAGDPIRKINWTEVKIDGEVCRFRKPKTGQYAMLMSANSRGALGEEMGAVIQLMTSLGDNMTARYLRGRLWDVDDDFDVSGEGGLLDILTYLLGEWGGGRPTKSPSDYKPSQSTTGRSSTARTRAGASTSSPSRRAGSSR